MYLTSVQTPGLTCVLRILRSADDLLRPSSCSMLCSIAAGWNTHTVGQIQIQQETSSLYSLSWCSYCEGEDERPGEEAEHVGVFTEETADQQPIVIIVTVKLFIFVALRTILSYVLIFSYSVLQLHVETSLRSSDSLQLKLKYQTYDFILIYFITIKLPKLYLQLIQTRL